MTSNSGATAQDKTWQAKEQGDEARYFREKEQAQLAALREQTASEAGGQSVSTNDTAAERDFEGGFGGLEEFEDRYATTSGEH